MFGMYKNLQINKKKTKQPIKKMSKTLEKLFAKKGIQMANRHMKFH